MTTTDLESLESLRERMFREEPAPQPREQLAGYTVRINDGANYYVLYKDLFCRRIYHFDCPRPDPRILDCGSNIGLSVLYFKHIYSAARITAFEPDRTILPFLYDNLATNRLTDVNVVEAAVSAKEECTEFCSDAKYGSALRRVAGLALSSAPVQQVRCVRLRDYLDEPIDFLKMNIEGAETEVLQDCEDRLAHVGRMVVEYHHLPGRPRTLHHILGVVDRAGFDYLIHDFDGETNPRSHPPFRLNPDTSYYLLIYAQRRDLMARGARNGSLT